MTAELVLWFGFVAVALTAVVVSLIERLRAVARAVLPVAVVAAAVLLTLFGLRPPLPSAAVGTLAALSVAALGIISGSAVTSAALTLAMRPAVTLGTHGGILVTASSNDIDVSRTTTGSHVAEREVLRGGAAIGHLERSAVVGAAAIGHLEVIAAVIAIKGLGRFTELDTAESRERFIVGTLASMIWAGACAALVLLPAP